MQCTSPKRAGYDPINGKLTFSSKTNYNPSFHQIQLPCTKCIACKLEKAREIAIRCMHETQMHAPEHSHFITLTYSDKNLGDNKLDYRDIQLFIKKLRKAHNEKIKYLVCGEYGEKHGRKHWHILIWGLHLKDLLPNSKTHSGDTLYSSKTIDNLWGFNDPTESPSAIGTITLESAGYVARYTTKKTNGQSFARRSTRPAIGAGWLEKYYKDVFNTGTISLASNTNKPVTTTTIPRYYKTWMEKTHPTELENYKQTIHKERIENAKKYDAKERDKYAKENQYRSAIKGLTVKKSKSRQIILEQKFKKLKDADKL